METFEIQSIIAHQLTIDMLLLKDNFYAVVNYILYFSSLFQNFDISIFQYLTLSAILDPMKNKK